MQNDEKQPTVASPVEPVVSCDYIDAIDFMDYCIDKNKDLEQELTLLFMYWIKQKLKSN